MVDKPARPDLGFTPTSASHGLPKSGIMHFILILRNSLRRLFKAQKPQKGKFCKAQPVLAPRNKQAGPAFTLCLYPRPFIVNLQRTKMPNLKDWRSEEH